MTHLKEIAPRDATTIEAYLNAARRLRHTDLLSLPIRTTFDRQKFLPNPPCMMKWGPITLET